VKGIGWPNPSNPVTFPVLGSRFKPASFEISRRPSNSATTLYRDWPVPTLFGGMGNVALSSSLNLEKSASLRTWALPVANNGSSAQTRMTRLDGFSSQPTGRMKVSCPPANTVPTIFTASPLFAAYSRHESFLGCANSTAPQRTVRSHRKCTIRILSELFLGTLRNYFTGRACVFSAGTQTSLFSNRSYQLNFRMTDVTAIAPRQYQMAGMFVRITM